MKCLSCKSIVEFSSPSKFYCISCHKTVMREAILKDGEEFMYRNPIEELNLERPIRNILIKNGIEFIDQLTNMKFEDLKRLRQLSPARARIVRLALKKLGYDFSESAV